jgi:hypothetical protein
MRRWMRSSARIPGAGCRARCRSAPHPSARRAFRVLYRKLRGEAERAGTPAGHDAFYLSYVRLVELVQAGELGGGRFTAVAP